MSTRRRSAALTALVVLVLTVGLAVAPGRRLNTAAAQPSQAVISDARSVTSEEDRDVAIDYPGDPNELQACGFEGTLVLHQLQDSPPIGSSELLLTSARARRSDVWRRSRAERRSHERARFLSALRASSR